jgi:hypothetical protein
MTSIRTVEIFTPETGHVFASKISHVFASEKVFAPEIGHVFASEIGRDFSPGIPAPRSGWALAPETCFIGRPIHDR